MGVYIRGLKIEGKKFCPFQDAEYGYCLISEDEKGNLADCHALVKCPYEIVPDHGDLIDRDVFRKTMYHDTFEIDSDLQKWESGCWIRYKMFERNIESAPVVIPAERDVKVCPLYSDDEVTEYCVEGPCTDEMEGRCPIAERSEE